jgi:UDPglucose--hexose-1-phosphate uridylyltransferase
MTSFEHPHRRYNPLTDEWVLVSPHRTKRPWQGHLEKPTLEKKPEYDPQCYLCPGNSRAGGLKNEQYSNTFVFNNDFSALLSDSPSSSMNEGDILIAEHEPGICRVVCFSPKHNLTLAEMAKEDIKKVVNIWSEEYKTLGSDPGVGYVQIFENKGEIMGCSNPHPHGQIWAQRSIPAEPAKELRQMKRFLESHGECVLCRYVKTELKSGDRIVSSNSHFLAVVPFWAVWPFEVMILSVRHLQSLSEFSEMERDAFADILKKVLIKYDNLFEISFPYSSGIHQKPTDGKDYPECHFHTHFYPPLLRSASIKKFMVGYEMLANPQRDLTPESAAERLRSLPEKHYLEK